MIATQMYLPSFNTDLDFAVWCLQRDGLKVPPFSKHSTGSKELRAKGLTPKLWRNWAGGLAIVRPPALTAVPLEQDGIDLTFGKQHPELLAYPDDPNSSALEEWWGEYIKHIETERSRKKAAYSLIPLRWTEELRAETKSLWQEYKDSVLRRRTKGFADIRTLLMASVCDDTLFDHQISSRLASLIHYPAPLKASFRNGYEALAFNLDDLIEDLDKNLYLFQDRVIPSLAAQLRRLLSA